MKTLILIFALLALFCFITYGQIKIGDISVSETTAKDYFLWCHQHPDTTWFFEHGESQKENAERAKELEKKLSKAKKHGDSLYLGVDFSWSRSISARENYLFENNIGRADKEVKITDDVTYFYTGYLTKHEPTAQDFSEWYLDQDSISLSEEQREAIVRQVERLGVGITEPVYPIDYVINGKHHDVIAEHLLKILEDYQKDCYADSTLDEYATWSTSEADTIKQNEYYKNNPNDKRWLMFIKTTKVYAHKKPFQPFTDFVDWLKKKEETK